VKNQPMRVIVADDHPVVLKGLQEELAAATDIAVVGVARDFQATLDLLATTPADILVLDIGSMGGAPLTVVTRIIRDYPALQIIIFSSIVDLAAEFFNVGVHGYVTKEELLIELVVAIHAVRAGEIYCSRLVAEHLSQIGDVRQGIALSPQELSVLKLLAQGLGAVAIAEQLQIGTGSTQNYITRLRRKTGCAERTQLADWYRRVIERKV
jgi:DNA-binding NarL/FixJ family response regulator